MNAVEMITHDINAAAIVPDIRTVSIVVATDGSDAAVAAFKAARLIAAHATAQVHVLSVIEPMPILLPTGQGMIVSPDLDKSREESVTRIVGEQVRKFDLDRKWTLDILLGRPAKTIVDFAREQQATLIIIGANRHGFFGRMLGEETAMEIARLSDIPLLIASSDFARLPHRVVVSMDLSAEGLQLAPETLTSIVEKSSISCVHVKPRSEILGIDWADLDSEYELAMRERFGQLERAFEDFGLRAELVTLHGDPAREIADFASYSKAELIVVGVKRRRGRARAVGGRMAGKIVRHADCSVLIVPNIITLEMPSGGATDVIRDSRLWSATLREFTSRNAGRIVRLEVDDPEIGALVEAASYPFLGADYDHKDGRLTISLGDTHGVDRHLTRTITHPETLSILSVNGRDAALSVTHGQGQTLLTF